MKKAILTVVAVLGFSVLANSQTGFFVGGEIGLNTHKTSFAPYENGKYIEESSESEYSLILNPSFGFSLGEDWEMGAGLELELGEEDCTNVGGFVYGRRYFGLTDRLSWYVDAGVEFCHYKELAYDQYNRENTMELFIEPGLDFSINDHWGFDLTFDFMSLCYDVTWDATFDEDMNPCIGKETSRDFGFNCGLEPGSLHDMSKAVSISLFYLF